MLCSSASICSSVPQPTANQEIALYLVSSQDTQSLQGLINVSSGKCLFYQGLAISYIRAMKKQRHRGETSPVSALPEIMGLRGENKKLTAVSNRSLPAIVQNKLRKSKKSTAAHSQTLALYSGITTEFITAILD